MVGFFFFFKVYGTKELYEFKKRTTPSAIKQKNIFQTSPTAESFRKELFPVKVILRFELFYFIFTTYIISYMKLIFIF